MRIGIDANGRSFRWAAESVQADHSICGIKSDIEDAQLIWNNSGAGDPIKPIENVLLEQIWLQFQYIGGTSNPSSSQDMPANRIAEAIVQLVPQIHLDAGIVLAIPNMLDETGQSALIRSLEQKRLYDSLLLWRPIAIAMAWAARMSERQVRSVADRNGALVVWDFESPRLEVTELRWTLNEHYLCPVRHYPTIPERQRPYSSYSHAARQVARSIPQESVASVLGGPYGAALQRNWELREQQPVLYQDHKDPRRWKPLHAVADVSDAQLRELEQEIVRQARQHPANHYLFHGWSAAHMHIDERNVEMLPLDAVALGCREYASRIDRNQPTYYDTLPEYRVWAKCKKDDGQYDFDFLTIVEETQVEGNKKWNAARDGRDKTKETLKNFNIAQHKNALSVFVQNGSQYDDEVAHRELSADELRHGVTIAKKLVMDLPTTTRHEIPLDLNVVARAAAGHIKITIYERDIAENRQSIFGDTGEAEFSWKHATPEPEHKGFLEAQEVVGRIMDETKPGGVAQMYDVHDYKEMARLLVRKLRGEIEPESPEMARLQAAINDYRPGDFDVSTVSNSSLLEHVLVPWGYSTNSTLSQPTRGLFGSRMEADLDIAILAKQISDYVRGHLTFTEGDWWRFQNCLFVYATDCFKNDVRNMLDEGACHAMFSEMYSPGRVFSTADDFEKLTGYGFIHPADRRSIQYWSFFRCLCYHEHTALISTELILRYLGDIREYFTAHIGNANERKNALHAILFALRKRDPKLPTEYRCQDFLNPDTDLGNQLNCLIAEGSLSGQNYPKSMIPNMHGMITPGDNFSRYVGRFLNYKDTLKDRQIGSGLATS